MWLLTLSHHHLWGPHNRKFRLFGEIFHMSRPQISQAFFKLPLMKVNVVALNEGQCGCYRNILLSYLYKIYLFIHLSLQDDLCPLEVYYLKHYAGNRDTSKTFGCLFLILQTQVISWRHDSRNWTKIWGTQG